MKLIFVQHTLTHVDMLHIKGEVYYQNELKYTTGITKKALKDSIHYIFSQIHNAVAVPKANAMVTDPIGGYKAIKEYKKLADYLDCGLLIFIGDDLVDTHNLVVTSEEDPIVVYMEHIRAQMLVLSSGEGTKSSTPGEQPWDIAKKFNDGKIVCKDSYVTFDTKKEEFGTKGLMKDVNGKYIKDPDYLMGK